MLSEATGLEVDVGSLVMASASALTHLSRSARDAARM
jgi:hypothetical protein